MMNIDLPILYYTYLPRDTAPDETLLSYLSDARRETVLKRVPSDRLSSAVAELLLRYALAETGYDPALSVLWDGKPRFADIDNAPSFNISHTRGGVAVLLSPAGAPVGVDVEEVRQFAHMEGLAQRHLTKEEYAVYSKSPDKAKSFFSFWTAKEAVIKYTGEGFLRPIRSVYADLSAGRAYLCDTDPSFLCHIHHYHIGDAVLCTAVDTPVPPPLTEVGYEVLYKRTK